MGMNDTYVTVPAIYNKKGNQCVVWYEKGKGKERKGEKRRLVGREDVDNSMPINLHTASQPAVARKGEGGTHFYVCFVCLYSILDPT